MESMDRCIVVVDDDWGVLEAFEAIFEEEHIYLVDNGKDALDIIQKTKPHLIFLDLKMPGMSGLDVLQWMYSNSFETDVVIITALPQDHFEQVARQYGIRNYLRKPFDVDVVESIAASTSH